eukprot:2907915-Amphidinium_carterae.1
MFSVRKLVPKQCSDVASTLAAAGLVISANFSPHPGICMVPSHACKEGGQTNMRSRGIWYSSNKNHE